MKGKNTGRDDRNSQKRSGNSSPKSSFRKSSGPSSDSSRRSFSGKPSGFTRKPEGEFKRSENSRSTSESSFKPRFSSSNSSERSSERSSGGPRSFSGNKFESKGPREFKPRFSEGGSNDRPFNRNEKSNDGPRSFSGNKFESKGPREFKPRFSEGGSNDRPFNRNERPNDGPRSFSGNKFESKGPREFKPRFSEGGSNDRPFNRNDRPNDGPRSFSGNKFESKGPREFKPRFSEGGSNDRPFNRNERPNDGPRSFSGNKFESKGPREFKPRFSEGGSNDRPFNRNERSTDGPREFKPRFSEGANNDRPSDGTGSFRGNRSESNDSREFKPRFERKDRTDFSQNRTDRNTNFEKADRTPIHKWGKEGEISSDKPYVRPSYTGRFNENNATQPAEDRRTKPFHEVENRFIKSEGSDRFEKGPRKRLNTNSRYQESQIEPKDEWPIRLNRFIANSGVCSRRHADQLVSQGLISVNGAVVTEMGYQVNATDKIGYEGKILSREKLTYVLLNKPKDFITTVDDPLERKTVMQLVRNATEDRIFPVGRLDRNTTGLILLTNDGDLSLKLTHPSHQVRKIYQVTLNKPLLRADFDKISDGLSLEDGPINIDQIAYVDAEDKHEVGIELHSGKNRIVRRIFEHLGYDVVRLDRVFFAGLTKKDLPRGNWRYLNDKEIRMLKAKGLVI